MLHHRTRKRRPDSPCLQLVSIAGSWVVESRLVGLQPHESLMIHNDRAERLQLQNGRGQNITAVIRFSIDPNDLTASSLLVRYVQVP